MSETTLHSARIRLPGLGAVSDTGLSLVLLGVWTLWTIWQQWGHWPEDLSAVYIAGWLWQSGQHGLIYDMPAGFFGGPAISWGPIMAEIGQSGSFSFPFVYPPIWAVLTAPLTENLSAQQFANAVTLVQIPLIAGSVLLAARLYRPAHVPLWQWTVIAIAMLLLSVQAYVALMLNQPSITMIFLILFSFERLAAGARISAGVALALAAALKLTPAAFAVIFLLDRQYRAFAAFVVVGALLGALSIVLAGWPMHEVFLTSLQAIKGSALLSAINVSLQSAILAIGSVAGLVDPFDPTQANYIYHGVPGWIGTALALTAVALFMWLIRALNRHPSADRNTHLLFALSILIPLFGPLGWTHYYLLPLFLLPGLIVRMPMRRACWLSLICAVSSAKYLLITLVILPWPVATYVWLMTAVWLLVLAAQFSVIRRPVP